MRVCRPVTDPSMRRLNRGFVSFITVTSLEGLFKLKPGLAKLENYRNYVKIHPLTGNMKETKLQPTAQRE